MSQINEFRRIAMAHGPGSFRDHISNYFERTGRLKDDVAVKSLSARVNRELRVNGALHELAGTIIFPSHIDRGKQAEWTTGHEFKDDVLSAIEVDDSPIIQEVRDLLDRPDRPKFELPSSEGVVDRSVRAASGLSRSKQRDICGGIVSEEYERRIAAMEKEALRKDNESKDKQIATKDELLASQQRTIDNLTSNNGNPTNPLRPGRAIVRRRDTSDDDSHHVNN